MKTVTKSFLLTLLLLCFAIFSQAQKQALLVGTFHFHNPGMDAVKLNTFDVMTEASQKELEHITDQIKKFHPDKIFVEWDYKDQKSLDSLYELYKNGTYDDFVESKYKNGKSGYNYYKKNEIIQLGFRAAKKAGLAKVHAIDYQMNLPFDTVLKAINKAGQTSLMNEINSSIEEQGKVANDKIGRLSLTALLEDNNTPAYRTTNNGFYIKYINRAGTQDDFAGADAVNAWYKRNLYMYSLIQKLTQPQDQRIMILLGSGHVSMIKKFIDDEHIFKVVELKDLIDKK
jgi:pheromone shutdown protein TraB